MSSKTKIIVLHMKEVVYTAVSDLVCDTGDFVGNCNWNWFLEPFSNTLRNFKEKLQEH